MFKDFIAQVQREIEKAKDLDELATYVGEKETQVLNILSDLHEIKDVVKETTVFGAEGNQDVILTKLKEVLAKNANRAIIDTVEFDITDTDVKNFRYGLFEAIDDDDSYLIEFSREETLVKITVNLDATAGNLYDYGVAINKARRDMHSEMTDDEGISKYSKMVADPELASKMWREKYYGPARENKEIPQPPPRKNKRKTKDGEEKERKPRKYNIEQYKEKYWATMRARKGYFKGKAPYWRILNYGTQPLHSDWGGIAYPTFEGTFFVEKSIRQVQSEFIKEKIGDDENPALVLIEQTQEELKKVLDVINEAREKIELALADIEEPTTKHEFTIVELRRALGARFSDASLARVLDLVNRLERGEIDPDKRVELTKSGGKRVQKRVKQLYNDIMAYKET